MPTVVACAIKAGVGKPMQSVDTLQLVAGVGIVGDVASAAISPRQVLIVRKEHLNDFGLPVGYLKENLVISGLSEIDFQPGKLIHFEGGASVHFAFHCEPCKTIAERVPNLKSIVGRRGLLGVITQSGSIAVGTKCHVMNSPLAAMSSNARDRVCQVIRCIPSGKVLDYAALLQAAGLQRVYFRAIPSYLKHALVLGLPVHRVVTSRFTIPEIFVGATERLGTELNLNELERHRWVPKILDVLSGNPCFGTAP
jgi:alkylated DNA nucleotide flippase Atl1